MWTSDKPTIPGPFGYRGECTPTPIDVRFVSIGQSEILAAFFPGVESHTPVAELTGEFCTITFPE